MPIHVLLKILTWRIETNDINGSGDGIQMDENLQLQVKTDKENIFVDFIANKSKRMDLFYFQTNRELWLHLILAFES